MVFSVIGIGIASSYLLVYGSPIFALAAGFAVPVGLILFLKPEIGVLLIIFLLPLEELNTGGVSVIKLFSVVVFGCAIVHYLVFRRSQPLVSAFQNKMIFLFLIMVVFSIIISIDPSRTTSKILKLLRVIALYYFVINFIDSKRLLVIAMWVFLLSGIVSTLYGFLDPGQVSQRFMGTQGQPNLYALSMVPRIPLIFAFYRMYKSIFVKIGLLVSLAFLSYGIVLSGSRGGMIAATIALILYAILQKNRLTWFAVTAVLVAVAVLVMPSEVKVRFGINGSVEEGDTTFRRQTYQLYGLDLFSENMWFGIGLDGFAQAYAESEYRFLRGEDAIRVAHNTFLEILVGTGVMGFIPFLLLLERSLRVAYRYAKPAYQKISPLLAELSLAIFAMLGGYISGILFASRQYEKTFWFLLALPVILQILFNRSEAGTGSNNRNLIAL
jgi:O-antigen ligase